MLFLERPGLPSIEEVAQPELRLAGLRINPRTNGPSRQGNAVGLSFHRIDGDQEQKVTGIPEGARITGISWSHDSKRVAFNVTMGDRISLWYAELKNGKAQEVTPEAMRLNGVYGRPYHWLDEKNFVVRAVPTGRGEAPVEPLVPSGPVIQENLGKVAPARTLQDLLQNSYDESLYRLLHHQPAGETQPQGQGQGNRTGRCHSQPVGRSRRRVPADRNRQGVPTPTPCRRTISPRPSRSGIWTARWSIR